MASLRYRTGASVVRAQRHNHHSASYDQEQNWTVDLLPLPQSRTAAHLSTRWTGQTRLANNQGAIHESWMVRRSPRAPGFSSEQYAHFISFHVKQACKKNTWLCSSAEADLGTLSNLRWRSSFWCYLGLLEEVLEFWIIIVTDVVRVNNIKMINFQSRGVFKTL